MSKKIKVLHLIPGLGVGGAERLLADVCERINRERYQMAVAYWGDDSLAERIRHTGAIVEKISFKNVLSLDAVRCIQNLLKKHSADIVHSHFLDADLLAFAANVMSKRPHLIHVHSYPFPAKRTHALRYRLMGANVRFFENCPGIFYG